MIDYTIERAAGPLDVQVWSEFERACGDGFHEPRYEAGWIIDDVRDLDGNQVETTEEEDEQIIEHLETLTILED